MRSKIWKYAVLYLLGLATAGCMNAGGEPLERRKADHIASGSEKSFGRLMDDGASLTEKVAQLQPLSSFEIPASGYATYDGIIGGDVSALGSRPFALAGTVLIRTEFSDRSDAFEGRASNFVRSDGAPAMGTLEFSNGQIRSRRVEGVDFTIESNLEGDLTVENSSETYRFDLRLEGNFRGTGAKAILGTVAGDVRSRDTRLQFRGAIVGTRR